MRVSRSGCGTGHRYGRGRDRGRRRRPPGGGTAGGMAKVMPLLSSSAITSETPPPRHGPAPDRNGRRRPGFRALRRPRSNSSSASLDSGNRSEAEIDCGQAARRVERQRHQGVISLPPPPDPPFDIEKRRGIGGVLDEGEAEANKESPPGGAGESNLRAHRAALASHQAMDSSRRR